MSAEENKASVRRMTEEVFNKGGMSIVPELITHDYVYNSPFGEFDGALGFMLFTTMIRSAFPDIHTTIDDMIAEGNKVAVRLSWRGTFTGKFGDLEPTGKPINIRTAYFYRYKNGKGVEATHYTDMLTFYQQLGIPIPNQ
jgi:steroid delta-isomerase-like uncharacterized protein